MNSLRIFVARLTALFSKSQSEEDLDTELQFHFESEVAHHISLGLTEQQARDAARKRFGGMDKSKEAYRDTRGFPALEAALRNLRYGFRVLRKNPSFTIVATASLALGIGFTTAIFSLTDQTLLRALPIPNPNSLFLLHTDFVAEGSTSSDGNATVFSYPLYRELQNSQPSLSFIARASARVALSHKGEAKGAATEIVSGNYFPELGLKAAAGRLLTSQDDITRGGHPVIVLSHRYWTQRFQADPNMINQSVTINKLPMTIVGVAPATFRSLQPGTGPDIFVPIAMLATIRPTFVEGFDDSMYRWLNVFARLKPGVSIEQAQTRFNTTYRRTLEVLLSREPMMLGGATREEFLSHRVNLQPASRGINQLTRYANPLIAMLTMSAFVLLIACANVAGLLLARAAGRQREIGIRYAMGATRSALIQQLLTEGLMLALPAGLLGILVAWASTNALIATLPAGFAGNWWTSDLDPRMLAFALGTALTCGIVFSLAPAFQGTRNHTGATLKATTTQIAGGGTRLRQSMVTGQVALSLLLLVAAGLLGTSLSRLLNIDLGFRTDNILTINIDATTGGSKVERANQFYANVEQGAAAISGVKAVAAANGGPLSGSNSTSSITVEGYEPMDAGTERVNVNSGFFQAMGIPILAGRGPDIRDTRSAPNVVFVNSAFAKKYFGNQNPIGRRMQFSRTNQPKFTHTIVGVVADFQKEIRSATVPTTYIPYAQWDVAQRLTLYLRTAGDQSQIAAQMRPLIRSLDSSIPINDPVPLSTLILNSIYTDRVLAFLAAAFGILATVLAAIGLYGVVAYNATRRTREIGLRMALGALPGNILRLILKEAGLMIAAGITLGLLGVYALASFLKSQLFGIEASDPRAITAAALVLGTAALLAALLPAWRASRVNPVTALKHE